MAEVGRYSFNDDFGLSDFNSGFSLSPATISTLNASDYLNIAIGDNYYQDSLHMNDIISDESEVQHVLNLPLFEDDNIFSSSDSSSSNHLQRIETVNSYPNEAFENAVGFDKISQNKYTSCTFNESTQKRVKTKKSKKSKKYSKKSVEKYESDVAVYQPTVVFSTDISKSNGNSDVKTVPKMIIKLPPSKPASFTDYFAPSIADKVKMGRRNPNRKIPDSEFKSLIQNYENKHKRQRKSKQDKVTSNDYNKNYYSQCASDSSYSFKRKKKYVKKSTKKNNSLQVEKNKNPNFIVVKNEHQICNNSNQPSFETKIKNSENNNFCSSPLYTESIVEIKEEILDEDILFSEFFNADVKVLPTEQSKLSEELEIAIKDVPISEFDFENVSSDLCTDLPYAKEILIHSRNDYCVESAVNSISDLIQNSTPDLNPDFILSENVPIPSFSIPNIKDIKEVKYESNVIEKKVHGAEVLDLINSSSDPEVVFEAIEVSTPELEVELSDFKDITEQMLPINSSQVSYIAEILKEQLLNVPIKHINHKDVVTQEHSKSPFEKEFLPSFQAGISCFRNLSSSSSSGSPSSDIHYSNESPDSSYSSKRKRTYSCHKKENSRYIEKEIIRHCDNLEKHSKDSKYSKVDEKNISEYKSLSNSKSFSESQSPNFKTEINILQCPRSKSSHVEKKQKTSLSSLESPSHLKKYECDLIPDAQPHQNQSSSPNCQQNKIDQWEHLEAIEERRVLYVGDIPSGYTVKDLRNRFSRFGTIDDVQIKSKITNYVQKIFGFVTFRNKADAFRAIERGNEDPFAPKFDLNFGGRRRFCNGDYTDLDGKVAEAEVSWYDSHKNKPKPLPKDDCDFSKLLEMERVRQESSKKKRSI